LKHNLVDNDKLKVIGYGSSNGIDTSYFDRSGEVIEQAKQIKKQYHLKNTFVFCFVGRVVKDKGVNELLYAFNRLAQNFDNIKLLIVGNFEEALDPISEQSYNHIEF